MPNLYPFFECAKCNCRVQMAIECSEGKLPFVATNDRRTKLSAQFDHGDFSVHCRGQGQRYHTQENALQPYRKRMQLTHFNHCAGRIQGLCCFCASISSMFFAANDACFNCTRKDALRKEFARLYKLSPSSCPWAALPSVVLDKIICSFVGGRLSVTDGAPVVAF